MNKQRRKELERVIALIEDAREILDSVKHQEQEAFDNMPEGLQSSEKGERMEEIINYLDDAYSELESSIENINSAIE